MGFLSFLWVLLAIGIGGSIGVWRARTIQMTAMPQLVALFHALIGLAAVLVAASALYGPQASVSACPITFMARRCLKCRSVPRSVRSHSPLGDRIS